MAEMMISILVMSISYAAMSMSAVTAKQTAQHEAERLATYISSLMEKSDKIHNNFYMITAPGYMHINWDSGVQDTSFKATSGCSYSSNFWGGKLTYNSLRKRFRSGGTITITDSQGEVYYVIIAGITEGRIRISPANNASSNETPSE